LHYFALPVVAPVVDGMSPPDAGLLLEPELAPAASIGGPWRASEDFFVFFFVVVFVPLIELLIEPFMDELPRGFGVPPALAV
jgi:hypothetical protein